LGLIWSLVEDKGDFSDQHQIWWIHFILFISYLGLEFGVSDGHLIYGKVVKFLLFFSYIKFFW
jgi:hypothetical protein